MRFSIVIPHYEKQATLEKTLAVLISQKYKDQILVIDDWSINPLPSDVIYDYDLSTPEKQNQHTYRLSTLRNTGILHAENDAIIILDPDCIPEPDFMDEARRNYDERLVIGGRVDYQKRNGTVEDDPRLTKTWKYGFMIWGGCMMFSKKATEKTGWFDADAFDGWWGAEENDFANRCHFQLGLELVYETSLRVTHLYPGNMAVPVWGWPFPSDWLK